MCTNVRGREIKKSGIRKIHDDAVVKRALQMVSVQIVVVLQMKCRIIYRNVKCRGTTQVESEKMRMDEKVYYFEVEE